jgi:two-component system LytT family response regulator
MKIRTVIVDDEQGARENLIKKISILEPSIEIVGEADSVSQAQLIIEETSPHLIFLDITMPNENGFVLLDRIKDVSCEIIFITAHDDYAMKAFEYCASGYVLKPIDVLHLKQNINIAIDKIKQKTTQEGIVNLKNYLDKKMDLVKLAIPVEYGLEFTDVNEIVRLTASEGYTEFLFDSGKKILSSKGLNYFSKLLPKNNFIQIHRSNIINLNFVSKYHKAGFVVLSNKEEIPISRSRKEEFISLFRP